MKKMAVAILFLGAMMLVLTACSSKSPSSNESSTPKTVSSSDTKTDQSTDQAQAETEQDAEKSMELTGTVERMGEKLVIVTDAGEYMVADQTAPENLDEMLGKRVSVTATLAEESSGGGSEPQIINVINLSEIE